MTFDVGLRPEAFPGGELDLTRCAFAGQQVAHFSPSEGGRLEAHPKLSVSDLLGGSQCSLEEWVPPGLRWAASLKVLAPTLVIDKLSADHAQQLGCSAPEACPWRSWAFEYFDEGPVRGLAEVQGQGGSAQLLLHFPEAAGAMGALAYDILDSNRFTIRLAGGDWGQP